MSDAFEVSFHKQDREYTPGEQLTGEILLQPRAAPGKLSVGLEASCCTSRQEHLVLFQQPHFFVGVQPEGREMSLPFSLQLPPDGPLSYEGSLFSVGWSLKVRVQEEGAPSEQQQEHPFKVGLDKPLAQALARSRPTKAPGAPLEALWEEPTEHPTESTGASGWFVLFGGVLFVLASAFGCLFLLHASFQDPHGDSFYWLAAAVLPGYFAIHVGIVIVGSMLEGWREHSRTRELRKAQQGAPHKAKTVGEPTLFVAPHAQWPGGMLQLQASVKARRKVLLQEARCYLLAVEVSLIPYAWETSAWNADATADPSYRKGKEALSLTPSTWAHILTSLAAETNPQQGPCREQQLLFELEGQRAQVVYKQSSLVAQERTAKKREELHFLLHLKIPPDVPCSFWGDQDSLQWVVAFVAIPQDDTPTTTQQPLILGATA